MHGNSPVEAKMAEGEAPLLTVEPPNEYRHEAAHIGHQLPQVLMPTPYLPAMQMPPSGQPMPAGQTPPQYATITDANGNPIVVQYVPWAPMAHAPSQNKAHEVALPPQSLSSSGAGAFRRPLATQQQFAMVNPNLFNASGVLSWQPMGNHAAIANATAAAAAAAATAAAAAAAAAAGAPMAADRSSGGDDGGAPLSWGGSGTGVPRTVPMAGWPQESSYDQTKRSLTGLDGQGIGWQVRMTKRPSECLR